MGLNVYISFICNINIYLDCKLYKYEKTEHYITSHWSQLPDDMIYALCTTNYRHSFTKKQVKEDVQRMLDKMI